MSNNNNLRKYGWTKESNISINRQRDGRSTIKIRLAKGKVLTDFVYDSKPYLVNLIALRLESLGKYLNNGGGSKY